MDAMLDVQKRLLPDLIQIMQKRYQILRYIKLMEPVGRRSLSQSLGITERVLRSEIQFLKEQDLLLITNAGMILTKEGKIILDKLEHLMRDITGVKDLEKQLVRILGIRECIIVSGNSDESPWAKSELGRACVNKIKEHLLPDNIIAVTGGTTMATIADSMNKRFSNTNITFVPARGGIGEDVKNQANTISARMAENTDSQHMVLYVPDQVSEEVYDSIIHEPTIWNVLMEIKSANMLIHGIGDAMTMADRRKTTGVEREKILSGRAVAEAFGYYFNEQGEIVHRVQTIGLQLSDLQNIKSIFAVAGGSSKVKAIKAYMKVAPQHTILITDEAVARAIIKES
ncbi:sugar-binding transcriptional regulator [Bacillus kwashiorkori]|uniref:sugar-binding transcriptional regulator n=1 Tax=Bacillus kwashiorkori TaxID=1522318 RepID=UPI0007828874|nr:sugar-binding domain-containing protein [Bacillus kwashiorkori]